MLFIQKSIILIILVSILSCESESTAVSSDAPSEVESALISVSKKQYETSQMQMGEVQLKEFSKTIKVNGKIHLPNKSKAVVSSMLEGTVGVLDFVEGEWVRKGQALFTVTNPELIEMQKEYLVLRSQLGYLKEEEERKQQLVNENLAPNKELLLAAAEYQSTIAEYKSIEQKLRLYGMNTEELSSNNFQNGISVSAPISGYVAEIGAIRGQFIFPSTEVLKIDSRSHTHLELSVLEKDIAYIKKGQEMTFTVQGEPNRTYIAEVHLVNPSFSESGMINVHAHIEDDSKLIPGMFAEADIAISSVQGLAIPKEAIVIMDGQEHVLVQVSKTSDVMQYEPKAVKVGISQDDYAEILEAESLQGKQILIKGGYYLVN